MNLPSAPVASLSSIAPPAAVDAEAEVDSDADADGAASDAEADGAAADGAVVAAPPPLLEHAATIAVTAKAAINSFEAGCQVSSRRLRSWPGSSDGYVRSDGVGFA